MTADLPNTPQPTVHRSPLVTRDVIPDAPKKIIQDLRANDFEAFIVGGCIRDLLLGRTPKDFDVVTAARPEQIHELFPRSRTLGRRFRLVHVYDRTGHQVTEVATFRSQLPSEPGPEHDVVTENGTLLEDNAYGSITEDPFRRDFTVNAMYFDPDTEEIFDYVGGFEHAAAAELHTIGDADERFTEDPARILRAVRFSAQFGLTISSEIRLGIERHVDKLTSIKPARVGDEFQKLFLTGHARKTYHQMCEFGLLDHLIPQSEASVQLTRQAMANTDWRIEHDRPAIAPFLYAAMLWHDFHRTTKISAAKSGARNETRNLAAAKVIGRLNQHVAVPRRSMEFIRDTFELQHALEERNPKKVKELLALKRFRSAFDLLDLRAKVGEIAEEKVNWWRKTQEMTEEELADAIRAISPRRKRNRHRTRRRRRPRNANRARGRRVRQKQPT